MEQESADPKVCDELVRLLRVQRHDFINHLQVVHGMLQLGRTENAMAYIENLAKDPSLITDQIRVHIAQTDCKRNV
ncbi:MAG: Spo0B domain-containing protein [Veillonellales bacterium]